MKSSELLKMARERLWDGVNERKSRSEHRFVCLAISQSCSAVYGDYDHPKGTSLRRRIQKYTGLHYTMDGFLADSLGMSEEDLYDVMTPAEIQQKRFELIDKLIAEYEEKGD